MGLFRKKVHLTEKQERSLLTLSEYYHLPYTYFVNKAIEEFLDKELEAIKPEPPEPDLASNDPRRGYPRVPPMPPIPPKTRTVIEGEKP